MPKPMLRVPKQKVQEAETILSTQRSVERTAVNQHMDKMLLDRLLRQKRSRDYLEAIHKLDAGGHVHNQEQVDAIIDQLQQEFPQVDLSGILIGIVAICYLGEPYEVHTLDIAGKIVKHYQAGEVLPSGMEKARAIALRGGYDFIEVYIDCCRAVSMSGVVSVIPC